MQASHIAGISRAALGIAIIMAAWVASRSTWVFLQPEIKLPEVTEAEVVLPRQRVDSSVLIRNAHLFGASQKKAAARPKPVKRKASGSLKQATLLGLLAEGDGSGSAVIVLKSQKSQAKVYHDGDELPSIGQIHQIWGDRVVVNVAGVLESLYLKKTQPTQSTRQRNRGNVKSNTKLRQFRQMITQNPTQLGKHFAARPVKRSGKMIGYSISSKGAYRSLFTEVGLRNGDIVTVVNNIELTDTGNALQIYEQLQDARQISATILRGGRTLTINRSIDGL